ncbi:hypothetical protein BH10BAC5_BH10BAC5_24800 [soil metagenome]
MDIYLSTIRIRIDSDVFPEGIYIFWHSKMLIGWRLFKGKNFNTIVSRSNDGEILSNVLTRWSFKIARGSSSKGGKEALDELTGSLKNFHFAALTPDGPRGPAMEIKNGALSLAFKSGLPLIPVSINYSKKKVLLKSWDKFEIPSLFSTCTVKIGSKYRYIEKLENNELIEFKNRLKLEMI